MGRFRWRDEGCRLLLQQWDARHLMVWADTLIVSELNPISSYLNVVPSLTSNSYTVHHSWGPTLSLDLIPKRIVSPLTHWFTLLSRTIIPYAKLYTGLVSQSLPVWSSPSSDAQAYIWVSSSVGYPPPPSFVYNYKIRMPTGRRVWRFSILLLVDEYDDSPLSYLWTSMTTLHSRTWKYAISGTSHDTFLPLSLPRLHPSLFWSLLKPRGRSRVTFEAAMHIASLCRVRSDTMDITCHPNIFLHVGSPQVPNSWSARHGTVK